MTVRGHRIRYIRAGDIAQVTGKVGRRAAHYESLVKHVRSGAERIAFHRLSDDRLRSSRGMQTGRRVAPGSSSYVTEVLEVIVLCLVHRVIGDLGSSYLVCGYWLNPAAALQ